jgi:UDP-N-acetylmuramoylalanine--D-glutamate ligase
VENLILFPVTGLLIEKEIKNYCAKNGREGPEIFQAKDMAEAVGTAYKVATVGSICLLSCASPSFNLFKNFEERGNLFKKFVREFGSSGDLR